MSKESAHAFIERMKADSEFATKIREFQKMDDVKSFIKHAGFEFTQEEMDGFCGELTDDDLDQVSGGKGSSCPGAGTPCDCTPQGRGSYVG